MSGLSKFIRSLIVYIHVWLSGIKHCLWCVAFDFVSMHMLSAEVLIAFLPGVPAGGVPAGGELTVLGGLHLC